MRSEWLIFWGCSGGGTESAGEVCEDFPEGCAERYVGFWYFFCGGDLELVIDRWFGFVGKRCSGTKNLR